jgi:hypothetical protein
MSDLNDSHGASGDTAKFSVPLPNPALRAALFAKIAAEPAPVRPTQRRWDAAIRLGGFLASLAIFLIVGGVSVGERPAGYVAAMAVAWGALFLLLSRLLVPPPGSALGPRRATLAAIVLGAPLALTVLVVLGRVLWPATATCDGPNNHSDRCFFYSCLFSAPILLAFVVARRGTVMRDVALHGAAFGAIAGCFGALLITLRCVYAVVPHLLVGHVAPVILLGVVVALLAEPILRFRER